MKLIAILVCLAVLVAERPAEACSCAPPPPPCEAYWRAPAVFTGKVTSIQTGPGHATIATFAIKTWFKGSFLARSIIVEGGGMCGATFESNGEYFVYATNSGGIWRASLCGRTRRLREAKDDIAYASNLPRRKLGVIEGTVTLDGKDGRQMPRAGVEVRAQGTPVTAKTDRRGRYMLPVPPGTYTLDVVEPGLRVRWGRLPTVEVRDVAACARGDISVEYNGRIRGRIIDHTGTPAANVPLSAQPIGAHGRWRLAARTDANGVYEIAGVDEGSYHVVVNHTDEGGPTAGVPIPTTFYPGVPTAARAKPIAMPRSGLVTMIDFRLPRPLAVHTVSGVLRHRGQPRSGVHVKISTELGPQYSRATGEHTDAKGRFSFTEVTGAKITLEVCRPDANSRNYTTACKTITRTLTRDLVIDLDYPAP